MSNAEEAIDRFAFVRELRTESRERLRHGLTRKSLAPGANILRPGDVVDGVYLVGRGAIRVYYVDPEGREGTLYWIEPGESCILALNSLFTEIAYPAWADAEDCGADVLSISGALFRELFSREPSIQRFLFGQLSERVFGLLQILEKSMRLPQEERLVDLLLARADTGGVVHLSQDKLARHLGTIREVVSRLLRHLATQRLIAVAPRRVTILDRDRLARIASAEGGGTRLDR